MSGETHTGRLSTLAAAFIVARRDFSAILFSRSFIFFLLGPLIMFALTGIAGGIGQQVRLNASRPELGIAMPAADSAALVKAQQVLSPQIGSALPALVVIRELKPGETFDPVAEMKSNRANLAAIVTGTLEKPVLTGPDERIADWQGKVSLLTAHALRRGPDTFPQVALSGIATSKADRTSGQRATAQIGQTVLFMLMMILAGMVMSNLVEEKGNKIIEVLAAAVPMDAVFLGKLFAMLAISLVGITVWFSIGAAIWFGAGNDLGQFPAPAVGWPTFFALGVVYFAMGYLVLGSIFLAIGSLATTVREVQTLSMPVTMLQLLNFFFANFAMAKPGSWVETTAMIVPFSSPFTMLARAAQHEELWPHGLAIAWLAFWVFLLIRGGALLFKKRVMMSGPAGSSRSGLFRRKAPA